MTKLLRIGLTTFVSMALPMAFAQEVHNLSEGQPTSLEDAYPTPEGERNFLLFFAYDTSDDIDVFTLEPGFQLGLARDWQARISLPFFFTDEDDAVGDLRLQVLWGNKGLNDPDTAFAIAGELDVPIDDDDTGDDEVGTRLKLILSHPLDPADPSRSRLHFNAGWLARGGDEEGVVFALGYSQLTDPQTAFVADLTRLDPEVGDESNLLEFGLRRQFNMNSIGSIGLRFGLNDNAPDFGITLGWQARL